MDTRLQMPLVCMVPKFNKSVAIISVSALNDRSACNLFKILNSGTLLNYNNNFLSKENEHCEI